MRGRGRWRGGLLAAVFVLGVAALTGAGLNPAALPSSAAAAPRSPSDPVAPGAVGAAVGTTVDAVASAFVDAAHVDAAVVDAQALAAAGAEAEVAASAQAVTSAAGAVDAIAEQAGIWIGVAVLDRVTGQIAIGARARRRSPQRRSRSSTRWWTS